MSRMVNGREVMEDERRVKKRKPLSDCTNTVSSRISSHSHAKPRKHSRSTKAADNNSLKYDTSTGSNAAENPGISISPSTPPPQQTRSVSSGIKPMKNIRNLASLRHAGFPVQKEKRSEV
uniref:Uncharacterized protein n=1 Tax=Nelumbo nucifera TaxID=4432 RepID=A0A822Y5T6_NELNU|nr:TPA_asm: hypothetical protein HUJ06_027873 [Nelumbo nucifera]